MAATVLVVDDDLDLVKAMSHRLRAGGYDVISAHDGLGATQMAIRMKPDAIILDIGMPGGDGHTVFERLKAHPITTRIPVIYVTARDSYADRKKAMDAGALGYLVKPYRHQELLSLVARSVCHPAWQNGAR